MVLVQNPVSHFKAKYIDIHFHFIQEHIDKAEIKLQYIPTHQKVVDILTKAVRAPSERRQSYHNVVE